jgi:hypothetical protein
MERPRPFYKSHERIADDDGAVRIVKKPQSSETRSVDRRSERKQMSMQGLFIREKVHWEVTSEIAQRGSDVRTPGLL